MSIAIVSYDQFSLCPVWRRGYELITSNSSIAAVTFTVSLMRGYSAYFVASPYLGGSPDESAPYI